MRTSTKCPWCKREMIEKKVEGYDSNPFCSEHYLYCEICEAQGPRYFYLHGKKIYKPSKNGV